MVEGEGSTSKDELQSSLPPPPPPSSPSSSSPPPATLASRDFETKIQSTSPPLACSSSSSHLLDLPLLPDHPLLGDRLHAAESDLIEEHEGVAELDSVTVNQEQQQSQFEKTPVPSASSHPLDNSPLAIQPEDHTLDSTSSTSLDASAAPPPPQDDHVLESGIKIIDVGREGALEQSLDLSVEIEVGSGGGEEKAQVDEGGGSKGEADDAAVESPLLLENTAKNIEATHSSQLSLGHASLQDPSPLESPKTSSHSEDCGSRSSNGSVSSESQPLTSSFNSTNFNLRVPLAPPDLPSKQDLFSVIPNPRSSSLPAVLEPSRATTSIKDRVEASRAGSLVVEKQESLNAEQNQELPLVDEEDAYIDASSSQAAVAEVEPNENSDEDPEDRRDYEEGDQDGEEEEEEEKEDEEEIEVEEGSHSAGSFFASSLPTRTTIGRFTDNRTSAFDLRTSPGPSSSSSSKRKDPPPPSPTSSSRQTAPPVAKRTKQPFRSPMILSSPGRPSPSLLPSTSSTSSSNDLRRPSASSPPPSPPLRPPPIKTKRPKFTFKPLTVSLPPPSHSAASSRKASSSTNASKSAPPLPPPKRKKAPVVPFQSPVGGGGSGSGGGSTGFSQAKEIAEMERKVQMLKQALRFVGTAEGRRKEERERELVEKWKVAGREISQLLWDETPSSRDPSKDSNNNSRNNNPSSSSPFSFNDQPFNTQQPSPFLSSFEPQSFETSFGFSSTGTDVSSYSHAYKTDDDLELDSDSSLPSPKTVSRQIDQTLAKRANGARVGLGVRAYLEDRRERMGSGSRSIVEEMEEEAGEENGDDEHDERKEEQGEQGWKRKRQAEAWNVGEMLRRNFGVDPVLFGWDGECEDWL